MKPMIDRQSGTARVQSAQPRVLTVTSGKGGVGKSSIAVNLGITLARAGRRVCILDADTGLANVNILLGLHPQKGLAEVLTGECPVEDVLLEGPHGLKVIPGASGIRDCVELSAARQRRLVTELARIEQHFDDLILDTAAGIGDTTLDFVAAGHQVLLVITPEPTSLTDAFSLLKVALRRYPLTCQVVVNMVADISEARAVYQRFSGAVEKYLKISVGFLGFIQRDESLRAAVTLQHPVAMFSEHDPSVRPFQRLAQALNDLSWDPSSQASFSRFWFRHLLRKPASSEPVAVDAGADDTPSERLLAERGGTPDVEVPAPESGSEVKKRFEALRREFRALASAVDEPCALAEWIQTLEADYRDRFGIPAVDPEALIEWLLEHPETSEDVLERIGVRLEQATRGEDAACPEPPENVVTPDFGRYGPLAASERPTPIPKPDAIHRVDVAVFGSQQDLLQWLRDSRDEGQLLIEQLERRGDGVAPSPPIGNPNGDDSTDPSSGLLGPEEEPGDQPRHWQEQQDQNPQ